MLHDVHLLHSICCLEPRDQNEPSERKLCPSTVSVQEFVINTPCENAEKMYIGNAMYGNYAAVFAQLIINGRSQGLLPTQKPRIILFTFTIFQRIL